MTVHTTARRPAAVQSAAQGAEALPGGDGDRPASDMAHDPGLHARHPAIRTVAGGTESTRPYCPRNGPQSASRDARGSA
jgi:hypothetical protein